MTPTATQDASAPRPALQSWRTTTAVRVFALALATGTVLSNGVFVQSAPILVVLALVAAVTSLLEWMTRNRPLHWHAVAEAVAVTALLVAAQSTSDLGAYLAVPPIAAGVRHGLVTTLNVTLVSVLTVAATVAADPAVRRAAPFRRDRCSGWPIGLGVGLLASWQSRSTRDHGGPPGAVRRRAPPDGAHPPAGDARAASASTAPPLAMELDTAMRRATAGARSTVFVAEPDDTLRPLNGGDDVDRMAPEIELPESERTPGAAVVPLRGAQQVLGYCVLVGVPRWTPELDERASEVADEFAVRLDTAVLFDEVRALATSEERNRIAREMHDGVAQEIVGLGYIVDEIESISDQEQTRELASALRAEITRLVSEIRFSIFDLRHEVTDGRLSSSLADYAREVGHATGLRVHLSLAESGPPAARRGPRPRCCASRRRPSATSASTRGPTTCGSRFDSDGSTPAASRSRDDGVGNAEPREHHWGLQTMRERAAPSAPSSTSPPRPDGGTVVSLRSPTTAPPEGETAHGHHRATG